MTMNEEEHINSHLNSLIKLEKDFGDKFKEQLIDQYKLLVENANRISSQRLISNSFYITLLTAVLAIYPILKETSAKSYSLYILGFAGIGLSIIWWFSICSYRTMNSIKFKIINKIEEELPASPFKTEYEISKNASISHITFTKVEAKVPWVFIIIFVIVLIIEII
jgi:hypothetical protein